MDQKTKMVLCCVGAAILLNLVLSHGAVQFADADEVTVPEDGNVGDLSFTDQLKHMLSNHAKVSLSSSVLVGIVVALSVVVGDHLCDNSAVQKLLA